LVFLAAQELDQECGEFLLSAAKAFAWKERTQNRVLADSCVELFRELPATRFAAQCF
jgi:hypothetical protein